MQRLLALSAIALLTLAAVPAPVEATPAPGTYYGNGNLPPGCPSGGPSGPGCYHMRTNLNYLDTPIIDVLIVAPASPHPERDVRVMRQAIEMWDAGLHYLAREMGMDWLADGVEFNIFLDDDEFTTHPLWDPEIVVVASNPVGGAGIGIDPFGLPGPCKGANPLAAFEAWENLPGFDRHHAGHSGTYVESCEGGGTTCYAINGAIDPANSGLFNLFDLVAHEVGHCLSLGHVGDGLDHSSPLVPRPDIMSYTDQPHFKCVSTLDVEVFALRMSKFLPRPGFSTPQQLVANGGAFHTQHPSDNRYASTTGLAPNCPQPDAGLVPGETVDFYPGDDPGDDTGPRTPRITITNEIASELDPGQPLRVEGLVEFVSGGGGSDPDPTGLPNPTGSSIAGGITIFADGVPLAYNELGSIVTGLAGDPAPKFLPGDTVALNTRFTKDSTGQAGPSTPTGPGPFGQAFTWHVWTSDGELVSTVPCTSTQDGSATGNDGFNCVGSYVMPEGFGRYFTTLRFDLDGRWVCHTGGSVAGRPCLKAFDVGAGDIGAPASMPPALPSGASAGLAIAPVSVPEPHSPLPTKPSGGLIAIFGAFWGALFGGNQGPVQSLPIAEVAQASFEDAEGDGLVPVESMDATRVELVDTTADIIAFELEVAEMSDLPPSVDLFGLGGASFKHGIQFCTAGSSAIGGYAAATYGEGASECYGIEFVQGALGDTVAFSVLGKDGSGCGIAPVAPIQASVTGNVVRFTVPRAALTQQTSPADVAGCGTWSGMTGTPLADGERLTYLVGQTRMSAGLGVTFNPTVDNVGGKVEPQHVFSSAVAPLQLASFTVPSLAGVGTPVVVAASLAGGAGTNSCQWTATPSAGVTFGSPASCTSTQVTFGSAGAYTVAFSATDGTTSVGDEGSVAVTEASPVGERVDVTLGGATASAPVDSSGGAATWALDLDLGSLAPGTYTLTATWYDAEGAVLASATVQDLTVLEGGEPCSSDDLEDGGSGCVGVGNVAPAIATTFTLSDTVIEEIGVDQTLTLTVTITDRNGVDHIDASTLQLAFSPEGGITVDYEGMVTGVLNPTTLQVLVPFTVPTGAPVGLFDITVSVSDKGVGTAQQDRLSHQRTFTDAFELLPAGKLLVQIVGGSSLSFGSPGPDAANVASSNYFIVRNSLHEAHAVTFFMDDFRNVDMAADCSLASTPESHCIRLVNNLVLLVDETAESDGSFTFDDATPVPFTGPATEFADLADGQTIGVKLVILAVGSDNDPKAPGKYASTFSVVEM